MKYLACVLALCATPALLAQPNTLTQEEIDDGWILLWDGQTEFGWEWHGGAQWQIRDGVLAAIGGEYGWLGTTATFGDFHLKLEFKTAADGNSGVFLRSAREGLPHQTGYELQIFDAQPQGFNTGSLVFYEKGQDAKIKPDVWNTYDIFCQGSHFQVILNGELVFDGDNATHAAGVIGLQYNPGKPIEFRNIKLRPLGLEELFNGRDTTGWRRASRPNRPDARHNWTVPQPGVLHVEGGPGQLQTDKKFRNLMLQLGVKVNAPSPDKHPNSGVFIRGDENEAWMGYEIQIRNEFEDGNITRPVDFGTGGVYFWQPSRGVVAQDGEWFKMTINAYDRHISVWVNGVQTADYEDPKPEGPLARKQANLREGVIALQAHDPTTDLDFSDIRGVEIAARPMRLQQEQ